MTPSREASGLDGAASPRTTPARVLIVAGSDSGGGAGIQADIKTVTMLGGFPTTAITALTAQNTRGVTAVMPVPAEMVVEQIEAVLSDIGTAISEDRGTQLSMLFDAGRSLEERVLAEQFSA